VAVHPGSVYTNMTAAGIAQNAPLPILLAPMQCLASWVLLKPAQAAHSVLWCATRPGIREGAYYERCAPAKPAPAAQDAEVAARLWEASESWLNSG